MSTAERALEPSGFVEGPVARTLLLFALPIMGGSALQSLNGVANAAWVGHMLGATALAAISSANIVLTFMQSSMFGISVASGVLIAQATGANDPGTLRKVISTSTAFFVALSLMIAVIGFLLTSQILAALRTPGDVQIAAQSYLRMMFVAMPMTYFFLFMMAAQRGMGDSRTPFVFMAVAVALDVGLTPLLILGVGPLPQLGIAGSAVATLIGQGTGLVAMLIFLYRADSPLLLRGRELFRLLQPDLRILNALVLRGLPMGMQMIVISGSAIVMITLVNSFGSSAVAAYGAATQLWTYIQMPALALGAAVTTMTAHNVGAGRWDRVSRTSQSGVALGVLITAGAVILTYALDEVALRLLLPLGGAALRMALHINAVALWGLVFFGVTFVLLGVVRASGAALPPLVILFVSMWLIRVPFALMLAPRLGADAVWWSFPVGALASSVLAVLYYSFGNWRRVKLV